MGRTNLKPILIVLAIGTLAACNPTWTKDGSPNDSSMPVPPGGTAPRQAAPAETPSASASKP
jgi:hypothetical protein